MFFFWCPSNETKKYNIVDDVMCYIVQYIIRVSVYQCIIHYTNESITNKWFIIESKFKMAPLRVTVYEKSPYYRPLLCKQTTKNMNFQNLILNFSLPDLNFQAINYRLLSALDINALRLWFKFQANLSGSFCEPLTKVFFTKSIF